MTPALRIVLRRVGAGAVVLSSCASAFAADSPAGIAISPEPTASSIGLPLRPAGEPLLPASGIGVSGLIFLAVLAVATVGWAGWRQRRMRAGGGSALRHILGAQREGISVVQSVRLTPSASVHVVEWNGRQHLLACGEGAITALADRDKPAGEPVAERT